MRIVVAMSGGVDSSVSALLLKEQGHEVIGVFLRNGIEAGDRGPGQAPKPALKQGCCGAIDSADAAEVAGLLGVPYYALDQAREFGRIVDAFVDSYASGDTPNPCVMCNREIKFGALLGFARALGAERIATGHYARLATRFSPTPSATGEVELRRARDHAKDQSYVLAAVAPAALALALFPIGELEKEEVRAHARRAGLPVHSKPESQEICFVPTGDYRDLLRSRRPELFRAGAIRDTRGAEVGRHEGTAAFTIGQRRGLNVAFGVPRYVVATEPSTNTVVVGERSDLLTRHARLERVSWLMAPPPEGALDCVLQLRAHHEPVSAVLRTVDRATAEVELAAPGAAITPGQLGVAYLGERVVASGTLRLAK